MTSTNHVEDKHKFIIIHRSTSTYAQQQMITTHNKSAMNKVAQ